MGKIRHWKRIGKVLVSGDHGTVDYDEPTAMRDALVKLGVPSKAIYVDYAGFRTLDSIVRAHKVFGLDRCTIVTDGFHLPRALYLASENHLEAVGYQPILSIAAFPLGPTSAKSVRDRSPGSTSMLRIGNQDSWATASRFFKTNASMSLT